MGYIEDLRALIGGRPIVMVGAGVIVLDDGGCILLQLRTDNACWSIPGGCLEPGETLEEAARREVREETGVEIDDLALFHVFSGEELYYRYPNGDEVYNVSAVYVCRRWHGQPGSQHDDESAAVRFFPADRLPENISPPVRPMLRKFLEDNPNA